MKTHNVLTTLAVLLTMGLTATIGLVASNQFLGAADVGDDEITVINPVDEAPIDDPAEPVEDPDDQGSDPTEPGEDPADPGDDPLDPVECPIGQYLKNGVCTPFVLVLPCPEGFYHAATGCQPIFELQVPIVTVIPLELGVGT